MLNIRKEIDSNLDFCIEMLENAKDHRKEYYIKRIKTLLIQQAKVAKFFENKKEFYCV